MAMRNNTRCYWHGARGGRPKGIPIHPNTLTAMVEGRRRWVERMRELKAAGVIAKFPNASRKSRGLPPLSKDHQIRKAQRIIEVRMAKQDKAVVTAERPWPELSKADKLAAATDLGLDVSMKILTDGGRLLDERGLEGMDPKLLAEVRGTALSIISDQIRIDAAALQASAIRHGGPAATELAEEQRLLDTAFAGLGVRRTAVIDVAASGDDITPAPEGEDV